MSKKLFKQVASTDLLTNKELLTLLSVENLTLNRLFNLFPKKALKIIKHRNFINFDINIYQSITYLDEIYPELLRTIYDPPAILYYRGDLSIMEKKCFAIVGARLGTSYSNRAINKYCGILGKETCIVSGMAKGVDSMAHIAALKHNISTIAVMGTGITECYPKENYNLKANIQKHGLVLSEFPPGHITKPYNFVQRNRIIAGMSEKVIITEAKKRSGSLITATIALENGREVLALPGSINSELSQGTNELIDDGAQPFLI